MNNNFFVPTLPTGPIAPANPSPFDLAMPKSQSRSSQPVFAGAGNDVITLGNGANTVFAGEGNNLGDSHERYYRIE